MAQHITVFVPNRPGELFKVARILGEAQVNIIGYHLSCQGGLCLVQLICIPSTRAFEVIRAQYTGYCVQSEVVVVRVPNRPGQLFSVLEVVSKEGINLSNSYLMTGKGGNALIILEPSEPDEITQIKELLKTGGFDLLDTIEGEE